MSKCPTCGYENYKTVAAMGEVRERHDYPFDLSNLPEGCPPLPDGCSTWVATSPDGTEDTAVFNPQRVLNLLALGWTVRDTHSHMEWLASKLS